MKKILLIFLLIMVSLSLIAWKPYPGFVFEDPVITGTPTFDDGSIANAALADGTAMTGLLAAGVAKCTHVAHSDGSPVELLAADTSDRTIMVYVVCSETAAGDPDVDIGETDTVNKFIEDLAAGAWTDADIYCSAGTLTANKACIATIAAAGTAGEFDIIVWSFPVP